MKPGRMAAVAAVLVWSASAAVAAETGPALSGRIKLFSTAYLQDNPAGRFFAHEAGDFGTKRVEVRLNLAGSVNDRVAYRLRLDAFTYPGDLLGAQSFPESDFLGAPLYTEYAAWDLYEAAIKVSGFLFKNLDLTIGKQRIAWGTADKVGVVDNLNPVDFANFFTFDPDYFAERRPQTGFNFEYFLGGSTKVQFVWLIQNQVSPMPYGFSGLASKFFSLAGITVDKSWDDSLRTTNVGLRLSSRIWNIDAALSYYAGNSALPFCTGLAFAPLPQGRFYYPRLQVVGVDVAGEIAGVGFWAEAAYIRPEKTTGTLSVPALIEGTPIITTRTFSMFESGFFKYVLGADYNFGGGFYGNVQFLHGFFDEFGFSGEARSAFALKKGMFFGRPSNYVLGRLEYKAGESVKIKAGFLAEMSGDSTALALTPELELKIADGLTLQGGAFAIVSGGETTTKFGTFKKDKTAYLALKADF